MKENKGHITYILGWLCCPVCGVNIDCVKRRSGDLPNQGRIVYRPKICPKCGEEYVLGNTIFYARQFKNCPDDCLFPMGEQAV